MGMSHCLIMGYGISLDHEIFVDDFNYDDLYDVVADSNYLSFIDGDNAYIMLTAGMPWEFNNIILELTPEDVGKEIYRVLAPYLREHITEKTIIEMLEHIDDYIIC